MVWIILSAFFLLVHLIYREKRLGNLLALDLIGAKKEYQRLLEEYMAALGELSAAKACLTQEISKNMDLGRQYGELVLKYNEAKERLITGGMLQ